MANNTKPHQYLLSIIIPEYNQNKDYLKECLDSIFVRQKQVDLSQIQVILVKDSLEDDVSDYCNRRPITVLQTTGHTGCGMARQTGLDAALGEWIYFMDSDDYLLTPLSLHYRVREIEQHTEALRINFSYLREADYTIRSYGMDALYGSIYRRSIIKEYDLHFRPNRERFEDVAFVSTYTYLVGWDKVHCSTLFPIYFYRNNLNSITKAPKSAGYFGQMDLWSMNYSRRTLLKAQKVPPKSMYRFYIFRMARRMGTTDFKAVLDPYLSSTADRRNFNIIMEQAETAWKSTTPQEYEQRWVAFRGTLTRGRYPALNSIDSIVELCHNCRLSEKRGVKDNGETKL